jgi:hypothetical protein
LRHKSRGVPYEYPGGTYNEQLGSGNCSSLRLEGQSCLVVGQQVIVPKNLERLGGVRRRNFPQQSMAGRYQGYHLNRDEDGKVYLGFEVYRAHEGWFWRPKLRPQRKPSGAIPRRRSLRGCYRFCRFPPSLFRGLAPPFVASPSAPGVWRSTGRRSRDG